MKRRKMYDKVTQTVNEQIGIISHSGTVQEVFYHTGLAAGYLHGLVLAGTITSEDERTYMHTVRDFSRQAERRLLDGYKGDLSGDGCAGNGAVLCRVVPGVRVQGMADGKRMQVFAVREPGRVFL